MDSTGGTIPVTLAADAQTSAVSSISGVSKVPVAIADTTYTLKATQSTTANDLHVIDSASFEVGNGSGGTDTYTIDGDIDADVLFSLEGLGYMAEDDTFTITSGAVTDIGLNTAPAAIEVLNGILDSGTPKVTLSAAFTIAASEVLTIPAGAELDISGGSIILTNDASNPAKIIFAGTGATLTAGGTGTTVLTTAGGVFAVSSSTTDDEIPVSSFSDLTITGDNDDLASIEYASGTNPYITGPASVGGSAATLSTSTDCTT
jgi:hypothetical protein